MQNIVKKHIEDRLQMGVVLEKPKDRSLGHYATPIAFSLAKKLKKSPILIAQELALKFNNLEIFDWVKAVKGFLNFKLSLNFIEECLDDVLQNQENF